MDNPLNPAQTPTPDILKLEFQGNPEALIRYWRDGEGADRIRWGSEGDFTRCMQLVGRHVDKETAGGFCQNRHIEIYGIPNATRDARQKLAILSLTLQDLEFANTCHSPQDGRFCSGTGSKAGTTQPTATAKSKIRNKRYVLADPRSKEAVEALDAIEKVHDIPSTMPDVFLALDELDGHFGHYQPPKRRAGQIEEGLAQIVIDPTRNHQQLTTAHEFGHFIDHKAELLFDSPWNSDRTADPKMKAFRDAVHATPQYDTLTQLKYQGDEEERQRASYMLAEKEVFARAYAQYIGVRSDNKAINNQAQKIASSGDDDIIFASGHWRPDQFQPIAKALDGIFQHRGLLK